MSIGISIIVSFLLILANGYFSMSEMALVNASKPLLDHDAEEGDRRAEQVVRLQSDSGSFLATIQVVITLVGFFASAAASTNLSDPFAAWMSSFGIGWLTAIAPVLAPILITLVVSYFSIVIGELVPKRIALSNPEGTAKSVSGVILAFQKIMKPLVWLTSASANGLAKLMRIRPADDGQVSEEEIKYMVSEQEDLSEDEKRMIHDMFELGDAIAREVMVPRVDVTAVDESEPIIEVLKLMNVTGYSRMPVYHEDIDQVIGVVNIKDLIKPVLSDPDSEAPVRDFVREAIFVPDTKDLVPLLSEMKTKHMQMAIIVDEYGGTAGIVTIEDIVEEIVGEIEDEYDPDNRSIAKMNEREWVVEGAYPVSDAVEMGWPIEDSEEYETLAGWLVDELDKLAVVGDTFQTEGWNFRVQAMDGHRIARIVVTAPEPEPDSEDAPDAQDSDSERERDHDDDRD
jgi:putative hemolysin